MTEQVYLVITERAAVFKGSYDADKAHQTARDIGGVVVAAPIVGDYRVKEQAR